MKRLLIFSCSSLTLSSSLFLSKDAKSLLSRGLIVTNIFLIKNIRIEGEAPAETKDPENVKDLTVNWPARGSIEFKNYSVKYRPNLPHVINNLNVSINSAEKVRFQ